MEKLNGFSPAQTTAKILRRSPLLRRSGRSGADGERSSADKTPGRPRRGPPPLLVVQPAANATPELGRPSDRQDDVLMTVFAAAVHNERQRLARALHDDLAQSLFVARLRLSTIVLTNRDDAIADALRVIGECLASSSRATREMMADLGMPLAANPSQPALITGRAVAPVPSSRFTTSRQTLRAWIIAVSRRVQREYGLKVMVEGACSTEPSAEMRLEICAAVRELLINIVKHARVSEARIHLGGDDRVIILRVEDNGAGFDAAGLTFRPTAEGGFGLRNVRDRLASSGGNLHITSAVGNGTVASLLIPTFPDKTAANPTAVRIDQAEVSRGAARITMPSIHSNP